MRTVAAFGPESALVFDSHGSLYGTTTAGGTACQEPGCGVVFELNAQLGRELERKRAA